jgi:hypothetical protein
MGVRQVYLKESTGRKDGQEWTGGYGWVWSG